MSASRVVIGVLVTVAAAVLIATTSVWSTPWYDAAASELRLSWSARPERIETCRTLTPAELAERPVHMRVAQECTGTTATYQLVVRVDGAMVEDTVIRGSGVRHDRPIFLLRRYPIEQGSHRVDVRVLRREPVDPVRDSVTASRDRFARQLILDTLLTFAPGRATLVTYSSGALLVTER